MYAKDFRALARQALAGRWGVAVGTGLVALLLGGTIGSSASTGSSSSVGSSVGNYVQEHDLSVYIPDFVWMALVFLAAILSIYAVVCFVIGGTVQLGYAKFNLALVDHREACFSDLFSQFSRFGDGFLLNLLMTIFVVLWSLLLVIPGIIASYSYAMAPYILYENPGMRPTAAIKASKELMRGNKWRLFCLQFSFIGWALLCALTAGIGYLWLCPYQGRPRRPASTARFAGSAQMASPIPAISISRPNLAAETSRIDTTTGAPSSDSLFPRRRRKTCGGIRIPVCTCIAFVCVVYL